jgi:hypothetical protein
MNSNTLTIVIVAVAVIAVIYLITVLRKSAARKAANAISAPVVEQPDSLKATLAPIVHEIETKQVSSFIKHWYDKFANNTLSVQDVELLNSRIAEGSTDQVNGILALHPNGRQMFEHINEQLKLNDVPVA